MPPEIVFFSRPDGYCAHLNNAFYDYTGLSLRCGEGGGWERILHPDDRETNWQRWLLSQSRGEPYALCIRLCSNDGVHRWFLSRSHPLRDENGDIFLWVGMSANIEEIIPNESRRNVAEIRELAKISTDFSYASEIAIRVNRLASLFSETFSSLNER